MQDGLSILAGLLAVVPLPAELSDNSLITLARSPAIASIDGPYRVVLGLHHQTEVVADYICSDVCPEYTVRVIHYSVQPGADCDRIGGKSVVTPVPFMLGQLPTPYCVPAILVNDEAFRKSAFQDQ